MLYLNLFLYSSVCYCFNSYVGSLKILQRYYNNSSNVGYIRTTKSLPIP